ncbi:MAG: hypothetical protein JWO11_2436 [Nocardioides sp.]|nr:hypothetical protein [Nocardioides sp.]
MPTTHKPNRTNGTPRSTGQTTGFERASPQHWLGSNDDPDVMLSVPDLSLGKLTLKVKELRADVDLQARVLDLLDLRVGARVTLGEVELDIENVAAQAMLKVRLDTVAEVVAQVMQAITANPELVTSAINLSVAADPELGISPETRTVRGTPLAGVLGGTLGARGAEAQVDAVQVAHRVKPVKAASKRAPRKSTTNRVRGSRK